MSKWNILLDFDRTVTAGHSGGTRYTKTSPMSEENKNEFKDNVNRWLSEGHNVGIITRGVDLKVEDYFKRELQITPVMNEFATGNVSIFAPDEVTFAEHTDTEWWAQHKVEQVTDLLHIIGYFHKDNKTLFFDDTPENVNAMKETFPSMICQVATAGRYQETLARVNQVIRPTAGGRRKTRASRNKRSKKTRRA